MSESSKKQALLNEYKGNLFEYLFAHELSKIIGNEKNYLENVNLELKKKLQEYQDKLRIQDLNLYKLLPIIARKSAEDFTQKMDQKILSVSLIGKLGASSSSLHLEDDLIVNLENKKIPISLKLAKMGTVIHTKSAGCKSVFYKYFNEPELQTEFNNYLADSYETMSMELHSSMEIDYEPAFLNWKKNELSELPGELEKEQNEILRQYYQRLAYKTYQGFKEIFLKDRSIFINGIKQLIGFSSDDLIQVKCLYSHKDTSYEYQKIELLTFKDLSFEEIRLNSPKKESSFFEVLLNDILIQFRIKPMNKFSVSGFKLNCSIKQISDLN